MSVIISIYNVLEKEYWPYRYYFLFIILCFITFKLDGITVSRMLRFLIICLVLILYKKMQNYLEVRNYSNLDNVKYWMWVSIIMNPVLYIVWKWDVHMYYKIIEFINNVIKNNKLKILIIIILWNISIPIKLIYLRFYTTLNMIKKINFYEFMFNRIYGFIISVLIFSDIIKYLLWVTGGYLNLIICIYIILYIINVTYTLYYHFFKKLKNILWLKKFKKTVIYKNLKKSINFSINIQIFKNLTIYKIIFDYSNILKNIEINEVYGCRVVVTIIGNYIKKHINDKSIINLNIDKMPEIWRSWINKNRIYYDEFLYISYLDSKLMSKIAGLKMEHILKKDFLNNNYKNFERYYNTYVDAIYSLSELYELYESVLVYKYYAYKKGSKHLNGKEYTKHDISIEEYEYIYKIYLLIVKNTLYYIWSFEFFVFQNKDKLTKLNVIDEVYVDVGYHVYSKDKQNFNQYDDFDWLVSENDFPIDKVIPWNEKIGIINEGQYILSRFISINNFNILVYVNALKNKELKEIILLLNEYIKKDKFAIFWNNSFSNLKEEMAKEYFQELKSVMDALYQEWEINYMNQENIFEKQGETLLELINHYKSKCVLFHI